MDVDIHKKIIHIYIYIGSEQWKGNVVTDVGCHAADALLSGIY